MVNAMYLNAEMAPCKQHHWANFRGELYSLRVFSIYTHVVTNVLNGYDERELTYLMIIHDAINRRRQLCSGSDD